MKQKYRFFWKKDGLDIHNLPLKIKRSSSSKRSSSGSLICPKCYNRTHETHKMKQIYKCEHCSTEKTIGDINSRSMKIDGEVVVYTKEEYKDFMSIEEDDSMLVIREVNTQAIPYVLNLIERDYEVFGNDDKVLPVMQKIHKYLLVKNKSLLVEFSNNKGLIVPTTDRISLFNIRDVRTVKSPNQLGLTGMKPTSKSLNKDIVAIQETSIDKSIDTFEKFKDHKLNGTALPKVEEKESTTKFANELTALEI